jgi:hypothetical protein
MRFIPVATAMVALLLTACSSSNTASNRAGTIATAPPAQTAVIRNSTPSQKLDVATPPPVPPDVSRLTEEVKLKITELPREYGYGPFSAYQTNEAAVGGFDNPNAVLKQMQDTGREGGFVQSLTNADGPGGAFTVDIWKDATGARAFFDQFPKPDKSITYQEIQLPQPLGEQSFAYQYQTNGQPGYSLAWRRGRLILGLGLQYSSGKESLDKVMALAMLLDQKAQAAKQ